MEMENHVFFLLCFKKNLRSMFDVWILCCRKKKIKKRNLYDVPKRQDLMISPSSGLALGSFSLEIQIVLVSIWGYVSMSRHQTCEGRCLKASHPCPYFLDHLIRSSLESPLLLSSCKLTLWNAGFFKFLLIYLINCNLKKEIIWPRDLNLSWH